VTVGQGVGTKMKLRTLGIASLALLPGLALASIYYQSAYRSIDRYTGGVWQAIYETSQTGEWSKDYSVFLGESAAGSSATSVFDSSYLYFRSISDFRGPQSYLLDPQRVVVSAVFTVSQPTEYRITAEGVFTFVEDDGHGTGFHMENQSIAHTDLTFQPGRTYSLSSIAYGHEQGGGGYNNFYLRPTPEPQGIYALVVSVAMLVKLRRKA
jgi:hypothetical protein